MRSPGRRWHPVSGVGVDSAAIKSLMEHQARKRAFRVSFGAVSIWLVIKLANNGFSTIFINDVIVEPDNDAGRSKVVGLPDLLNGVEIKNVSLARSENTIGKHIGKAKRKRGIKLIAIDISENQGLTDEEAGEMIVCSLKRHNVKLALMIDHSGSVRYLRQEKRGLIPLRRYKAPFHCLVYPNRGVAELADARASGAHGEIHAGSSPAAPTIQGGFGAVSI